MVPTKDTTLEKNLDLPEILRGKTFVLEYCPNCPKRYLVRVAGDSAIIDRKPYRGTNKDELTKDCLGFGHTLQEAATIALADQAKRYQKRMEGLRTTSFSLIQVLSVATQRQLCTPTEHQAILEHIIGKPVDENQTAEVVKFASHKINEFFPDLKVVSNEENQSKIHNYRLDSPWNKTRALAWADSLNLPKKLQVRTWKIDWEEFAKTL